MDRVHAVASAANISHVLSRQLKAPREAAELLFYIDAMSNRRFPPPWSALDHLYDPFSSGV
jgi:hypothetical protein